jgi:singapore isolate B (sub-type 7) whole genome shotgun sequence assembly, scaffold_12
MINLEIPAINVLSKVDLISKYGTVEYDLDYYTELPDMTRMLFSVDR